MRDLWQDMRYGLRVLLKNPGFTAIAVLTLTLGIGANTALFSVVNGVLLNPLPFPNPEQLVAVYSKTGQFAESSVSYLNFLDWERENRSFAYFGASRSDDYNLTGVGEPERVHTHMISAEFFPAYGLKPILGRNITPEEDRAGGAPVVVIGDGLWKRKFGLSPDVVGRNITLNGTTYTIIGVAQSQIAGLSPSDVYVPIGQWTDPTFRNRGIDMGMRPMGFLSALRAAVQRVDNTTVAYEVRQMDDIVARSIATQRMAMLLLTVFSGLALVPSAIGICISRGSELRRLECASHWAPRQWTFCAWCWEKG
jgi:MacB-like periplasmic core domain